MEYIVLIVSCWMIGLIAAIPIGPVNLICIRRTLQCGWRYGFTSGLGAALGDGVFASIAAFSLTAIAQLINGYSLPLQVIGGIALIIIGVRTFVAAPPPKIDETYGPYPEGSAAKMCPGQNGKNGNGVPKNGAQSRARGMASTFALTITNPSTFLFFVGGFLPLAGFADTPKFFQAAFAVLGVMAGSATWWLTLTFSVGKAHAVINDHVVQVINRISGALVALLGLLILTHVVVPKLFG